MGVGGESNNCLDKASHQYCFFELDWWDNLYIIAKRVAEFSNVGTKLDRFLPKNQHTQMIIEFWELG